MTLIVSNVVCTARLKIEIVIHGLQCKILSSMYVSHESNYVAVNWK